MPAKEWLDALDDVQQGRVLARASNLDDSFDASGRAAIGRLLDVFKDTDPQVWEFRCTYPRAKPPHLRLLGAWEGSLRGGVFYAVMGLTKDRNKVSKPDKRAAADRIRTWKEQGGGR